MQFNILLGKTISVSIHFVVNPLCLSKLTSDRKTAKLKLANLLELKRKNENSRNINIYTTY